MSLFRCTRFFQEKRRGSDEHERALWLHCGSIACWRPDWRLSWEGNVFANHNLVSLIPAGLNSSVARNPYQVNFFKWPNIEFLDRSKRKLKIGQQSRLLKRRLPNAARGGLLLAHVRRRSSNEVDEWENSLLQCSNLLGKQDSNRESWRDLGPYQWGCEFLSITCFCSDSTRLCVCVFQGKLVLLANETLFTSIHCSCLGSEATITRTFHNLLYCTSMVFW